MTHAHRSGAYALGSGEPLKDLDVARSCSLEMTLGWYQEGLEGVWQSLQIIFLSLWLPPVNTEFPASLGARYGHVTKFWPIECKQKYLVHLLGSVPGACVLWRWESAW